MEEKTHKKKINFILKKGIKKEIVLTFKKSDGSIVKFKAVRIIKHPQKIIFKTRRKVKD